MKTDRKSEIASSHNRKIKLTFTFYVLVVGFFFIHLLRLHEKAYKCTDCGTEKESEFIFTIPFISLLYVKLFHCFFL